MNINKCCYILKINKYKGGIDNVSIERQEATKYVIKEGYQDIYFLRQNGEWYYFEVRSVWRGKHIIRVKDGLLG
ncbi:hypothetical protein ACVNP0_16875 [Staphylococcus aureus]